MDIETVQRANDLVRKIESIERSIQKIQNGIEFISIKGHENIYPSIETKNVIEKIIIAKLNTKLYKTKLKLKEL